MLFGDEGAVTVIYTVGTQERKKHFETKEQATDWIIEFKRSNPAERAYFLDEGEESGVDAIIANLEDSIDWNDHKIVKANHLIQQWKKVQLKNLKRDLTKINVDMDDFNIPEWLDAQLGNHLMPQKNTSSSPTLLGHIKEISL